MDREKEKEKGLEGEVHQLQKKLALLQLAIHWFSSDLWTLFFVMSSFSTKTELIFPFSFLFFFILFQLDKKRKEIVKMGNSLHQSDGGCRRTAPVGALH